MAVTIGRFLSCALFCARRHTLTLKLASLFCFTSVLLSACADSGEGSNTSLDSGATQLFPAEVISDSASSVTASNTLGGPIMLAPLANADAMQDVQTDAINAELSTRLETEYSVADQQIVPTSGWICDDVFEQKRTFYFYPEGVMDADRKVMIERTLIADSTFNDVSFFYSVSGPDSLLTTSTITGEQGRLLSSGQQHDITTIRFTEVDSVSTFTAQSVLRGKLVCALFDLD